MPMLGRHERILAVDGVYIHVRPILPSALSSSNLIRKRRTPQLMPSTSKARAVFENARTMSYHIKSVAGVQQSQKSSSTFKLIVHRDGGAKRYEFEAESPKLASALAFNLMRSAELMGVVIFSWTDEIVTTIKGLKNELDRKGTVNKSRRSRQVGI